MTDDGLNAVPSLLERVGVSTGSLIEPPEIAALVAFLASDLAMSVTGADFVVDGNMIKTV